MKEKIVFGLAVLFLIALAGVPALYAEGDDSIISEEGRANAAEGASSRFVEVQAQAEDIDSDPSSFEGDSENMPGERAPEELPMSDTPAGFGVGID